jgi:hypothetical protein
MGIGDEIAGLVDEEAGAGRDRSGLLGLRRGGLLGLLRLFLLGLLAGRRRRRGRRGVSSSSSPETAMRPAWTSWVQEIAACTAARVPARLKPSRRLPL